MDDLLQSALVGTAKNPPPAADLGTDGLVAQVAAESAERSLLLRAGSRAVYQLAGLQPERVSQVPTPSGSDDRSACSHHTAVILAELLKHEKTAVLLEAIRRLEDAQLIIPPELLPRALDVKKPEVRTALRPIIGERGRWLSQFHEGWHWVATGSGDAQSLPADAERIWQEGSFPERQVLFQRLRALDPIRARDWLKNAWVEEKADKRADLLESFTANLSPEDEEFLERTLDDRSGRVRAVAARLLARISHSALAQRMLRRAENMLTYAPSAKTAGLRTVLNAVIGTKAVAGSLAITPPKEFDKEWERDGIQEKPPAGQGARTYWMAQVMALVPPSHWETHFHCAFADLIPAAATDDFGFWLLEAWSRAAMLFHEPACSQALWDYWREWEPEKKQSAEKQVREKLLVELLHSMDPAAVESRLILLLQKSEAAVSWAPFLPALPQPWSVPFAKTYLTGLRKAVQKIIASPKAALDAPNWYASLEMASTALPEGCFAEALQAWELPDHTDYVIRTWHSALDKFADVVRLRKEFLHSMQQPQT